MLWTSGELHRRDSILPSSRIYLPVHSILCITFWHILSLPLLSQQLERPFHIQYEFKKPFFTNDTTLNLSRKRLTTGLTIGGYGLSALYLGSVWYANEELSTFHFFDDSREWLQMDKAGHVFGAYHASKWMIDMNRWSGLPKKKAIIRGAIYGWVAMSSIELFDGFGEKWGASASDLAANTVGALLAAGNQVWWNENRIQMKVSYLPTDYAKDPQNEDLFGTNISEWLLKDYNGQVIWLSFRTHSFIADKNPHTRYPRWLNIAVGYGGEGMIGGYGQDPWEDIRDREYRQYYLGLDLDLSNIKTRSGFLHTLLNVADMFRIPMPAVQFDKNGAKLELLR